VVKERVTIAVDREKLAEARVMLGAPSASATVDIALTQPIRRRRLCADLGAYTRTPPTSEEIALGIASPDWDDLADDTDWESDWSEDQ
jgi:hypothetical protein